jgi:MFS family permease
MRNDESRLLGILLIAPFMAQADVTIANVATPAIHDSLHASGAQLQLVIGGYLISFAMLLVTGARLGQAYGYRRAFLAGVALFGLASLDCGLAPGGAVLIGARVVQGAGAAVMFPQTLTGIQLRFTGQARAAAIGTYAMALSAGAVTGQVLGGVLVSANVAGLGWRAVFLVNVPVAVTALIAGRRYLPSDARPGEGPDDPMDERSAGRLGARLDIPGVFILSAAVLLLVLPLTLGRQLGWPAWALLCLAASVPAVAAFVAVENRAAAPLLNLRVFAIPVVRWSMLAQAIATGTYYALLFTVAQYVQAGLGLSPVESGLLLVPWVAAGAHGPTLLAPLFGAGGLGLGTQFATLTGRMTAAVPARYAPDISGVFSTVLQIGGSIAVAGVGAMYLDLAARLRPERAFALTAWAMMGLTVLAAIGSFLASRDRRPGQPGADVKGAGVKGAGVKPERLPVDLETVPERG